MRVDLQLIALKGVLMYLPKWLYEILPLIYTAVGLMAIGFPEVYGRVSGVMLCVASFLIFKLRRAARSPR